MIRAGREESRYKKRTRLPPMRRHGAMIPATPVKGVSAMLRLLLTTLVALILVLLLASSAR